MESPLEVSELLIPQSGTLSWEAGSSGVSCYRVINHNQCIGHVPTLSGDFHIANNMKEFSCLAKQLLLSPIFISYPRRFMLNQ